MIVNSFWSHLPRTVHDQEAGSGARRARGLCDGRAGGAEAAAGAVVGSASMPAWRRWAEVMSSYGLSDVAAPSGLPEHQTSAFQSLCALAPKSFDGHRKHAGSGFLNKEVLDLPGHRPALLPA